MLHALALLVLGQAGPQSGVGYDIWEFKAREADVIRFRIQMRRDLLSPPKQSPKQKWEFPYITIGYGQVEPTIEQLNLRFRVYSQIRAERADIAPLSLRYLLRLWEMNLDYLRLDHSSAFFGQLVDVYLCKDGDPGGEHEFASDPTTFDQFGKPQKVNTVYIYNLSTFANPIEQARELAHEYGHATLPPVGGFSYPEYWVNGDIGERLFMTWIMRETEAGRLSPADRMGTSLEDLKKYHSLNVAPLIQSVALKGFSRSVLDKKDKAAFELLLGTVLWAEEVFPKRTLARALRLGGQTPAETVVGLARAAEEQDLTLRFDKKWIGKRVWLPIGDAKPSVKVIAKNGDWVQITVDAEEVKCSAVPNLK